MTNFAFIEDSCTFLINEISSESNFNKNTVVNINLACICKERRVYWNLSVTTFLLFRLLPSITCWKRQDNLLLLNFSTDALKSDRL